MGLDTMKFSTFLSEHFRIGVSHLAFLVITTPTYQMKSDFSVAMITNPAGMIDIVTTGFNPWLEDEVP
ncbi:hypothetical protein ADIS_2113 [Lunatimonas lonarensis]|uniref:Uncharacterized protein n=1 Tax=Lunatimonas lonarensis TaxID=1232681 RepID=R7ZTS2_9BACT|nr:hypothetical protein ADIS_2113 [Lunatimonas lonarensis]